MNDKHEERNDTGEQTNDMEEKTNNAMAERLDKAPSKPKNCRENAGIKKPAQTRRKKAASPISSDPATDSNNLSMRMFRDAHPETKETDKTNEEPQTGNPGFAHSSGATKCPDSAESAPTGTDSG